MKYVRLGRTGCTVSRICLGCMSYGTPAWRPWVLDEAAARPFFKQAVELGINFFDTADMYSRGFSEEITGKFVRQYARRDECVIATKVFNPVREGPNMKGLSRKHILQACEASLRRLGVDAIDLYQIHRFDPETPIEETLEALNLLVTQGKVRYIGASSGPAWRMAQALEISKANNWAGFVSMQNHYNLIYREEEREMVPLCRDQGVAVLPWSPLARGLLAGTRTSPADTAAGTRAATDDYARKLYDHPSDAQVMAAVAEVAKRRGLPAAQVSMAWLLGKPGVTAPLIGATKPHHLATAVAALDVTLTPDEVKELEAPYRPHDVRGLKSGTCRPLLQMPDAVLFRTTFRDEGTALVSGVRLQEAAVAEWKVDPLLNKLPKPLAAGIGVTPAGIFLIFPIAERKLKRLNWEASFIGTVSTRGGELRNLSLEFGGHSLPERVSCSRNSPLLVGVSRIAVHVWDRDGRETFRLAQSVEAAAAVLRSKAGELITAGRETPQSWQLTHSGRWEQQAGRNRIPAGMGFSPDGTRLFAVGGGPTTAFGHSIPRIAGKYPPAGPPPEGPSLWKASMGFRSLRTASRHFWFRPER